MDVEYVAKLAHLDLTADERQCFQKQLGDILAYMRQLSELDLAEVMPMSHGVKEMQHERTDVAAPGLSRDIALSNAPVRLEQEFQVPRIVE